MKNDDEDTDFGPMMTASEGEVVEESDDGETDVIFDRGRLLPQSAASMAGSERNSFTAAALFRNRKMNSESRTAVIFRGILVGTAFFTLGLCLSIVGPTLPDLQSKTNSSLSSVVSVISVSSFGGLLGVAFGGSCYACLNAFCVMAFMLFICAGLTVVIPWCTTLTGVTIICLLQGVTLGFLERGGYSMFYAYWKRKYHVLQLFYFALAFGSCVCPLVTTPFVFNRLSFLNSAVSSHTQSRSKSNPAFHTSTHFPHRFKRDLGNQQTTVTVLPLSTGPPSTKMASDNNVTAKIKKPDVAKHEQMEEEPVNEKTESTSTSKSASATTTTYTSPTTTSTTTSTSSATATTTTTTTTSAATSTTSVASTRTSNSTAKISVSTSAVTSSFGPSTTAQSVIPKYTGSSKSVLTNSTIVWEVREMSQVDLAYMAIAIMSMTSTLGFALMCCCMPCKSFRLPPENKWDYRFTPRSLCSSRENLYCILYTIALAFLLVGMESVVYNLLTVYVILDHGADQAKGVLLTALYWLTVSVSRLFLAIFKRLVNARLTVLICLGSTVLVTATMSVFSYSWTVVWVAFCCLGFTLGPIFPLSYTYLDYSLGFSPWVSTIWLSAAQLGRMTIPAITAAAMEGRSSPKDAILSVLITSLVAGVLFIFLQRTTKTASQLMAVDAFTRQITQANGDVAEYRRMTTEFDDLGGVEMGKLEDDLFDGDTVYYDRTKSAEDIFARYTNKRAVSET